MAEASGRRKDNNEWECKVDEIFLKLRQPNQVGEKITTSDHSGAQKQEKGSQQCHYFGSMVPLVA
jgi:hypothetical protein